MNSNNKTAQDYSNLPMDQTGNSLALQILDNNNNVGMSNAFINTATPAPQTFIYFILKSGNLYTSLPNDSHISRDIMTCQTLTRKCATLELLNERINLIIPDYQLSHRYNTILHSSHSTTNSARNSTSCRL
jgi:hypothetical protein